MSKKEMDEKEISLEYLCVIRQDNSCTPVMNFLSFALREGADLSELCAGSMSPGRSTTQRCEVAAHYSRQRSDIVVV